MPNIEHVTHTIILPIVDGIHDVLLAFFQTSDVGLWTLDDSVANSQLVIHMIRGNWRKSFLGFGSSHVAAMADDDAKGEPIPRSLPMRLEIAIRPSPRVVRINLRFEMHFSSELSRLEKYLPWWRSHATQEVDALRRYLKEFYDLPDLPALQGDAQAT